MHPSTHHQTTSHLHTHTQATQPSTGTPPQTQSITAWAQTTLLIHTHHTQATRATSTSTRTKALPQTPQAQPQQHTQPQTQAKAKAGRVRRLHQALPHARQPCNPSPHHLRLRQALEPLSHAPTATNYAATYTYLAGALVRSPGTPRLRFPRHAGGGRCMPKRPPDHPVKGHQGGATAPCWGRPCTPHTSLPASPAAAPPLAAGGHRKPPTPQPSPPRNFNTLHCCTFCAPQTHRLSHRQSHCQCWPTCSDMPVGRPVDHISINRYAYSAATRASMRSNIET